MAELSLILLIVLMPFRQVEFFPRELFGIVGISPTNFLWLIALVLVVKMRSKRPVSTAPSYFTLPHLLFLTAYGASVIWTALDLHSLRTPDVYPAQTTMSFIVGYILKPLIIVVSGWMIYTFCRKANSERIEMAVYVIPIVMLPLVVYFTLVGLGLEMTDSISNIASSARNSVSEGVGMNVNEIGVLTAAILAYLLGNESQSLTTFKYVSMGCALVVIVLTFSRISYIATLVVFVLSLKNLKFTHKFLSITLFSLIVGTFTPQMLERIQHGIEAKQPDVNEVSSGRINLWEPAIKTITEYPILGQGKYSLWRMNDHRINWKRMPIHPHNAYLEVALDMGFVGLCIVVALLVNMWRLADQNRGFRYVLMVWCIGSLTGYTFYPALYTFPIWVLFGIACARAGTEVEMVQEQKRVTQNTSAAARARAAKVSI